MRYFLFALITFCFIGCSDKCEDGDIQYDLIKLKKSISTQNDDINFIDVGCKNSSLIYIYQINPNDKFGKTLKSSSTKKEFSEFAKKELKKLYCNKDMIDFYVYKEKGIGVKWQYFFEGDKKPFCEVSVGKKDCE